MIQRICLLTLLFTVPALAGDFEVGDGIACGAREGVVTKTFSGESVLVRYEFSYFEGVPRVDASESVEQAYRCERRLGDSGSTGPELTKGDGVLCGLRLGTVLSAFTNDRAKVHFYASYDQDRYAPINETYLLNVAACERQLVPTR
ncbi:MAG: hypothetical protein EOP11_10415 [Proteobacteria bacterium]|nr:MAG: hypothetical protein EOP11_10415 [Pseudomonadota bacterium]